MDRRPARVSARADSVVLGGGISGDHLVLKNSIIAGNFDLGAIPDAGAYER